MEQSQDIKEQRKDVLKDLLLTDAIAAQRNKSALKEALFGALASKLDQLSAGDLVSLIKAEDSPDSLKIYQDINKMIENQ